MTTLILVVMIVVALLAAGVNDHMLARDIDRLKLRVWYLEHPDVSANGRHGPEGREW